jgi:hypothetical protein
MGTQDEDKTYNFRSNLNGLFCQYLCLLKTTDSAVFVTRYVSHFWAL